MNYKAFNHFCEKLPATSYVMQWGGSHVWKVGGKVFAVGGWNKHDELPAYSFKVSELNFNILSDEPGYRPAPYLASRGMKWIQKDSEPDSADKALEQCLLDSHRIVSLGLTKKLQKELDLNQEVTDKV